MTLKKLTLPYYAPNAEASDKYPSFCPRLKPSDCNKKVERPAPIVHINGFPGVGKSTIAKKLHEHINKWKIKVVQHHELDLLANTTKTPETFDHEQLRRETRALALNTIAESEDRLDTCYVFEDFALNNQGGFRIMEEYRLLALRRGCSLIRIELTCDDVAYKTRLKDQGRIDFRTENDYPRRSCLTCTDQRLVTSPILCRGFSDGGLKSLDVSSKPELWTAMSAAHHVMVTWNAGL
ncbi:hypothetical protein FPSE5266_02391 [Fusarium pseudograminearum]|nr:hypothetical protein FPSE5266_02391 [Fusarium pseudograminearum]